MSNPTRSASPPRRTSHFCSLLVCLVFMMAAGIPSAAVHAETESRLPLLVRTRAGDTPANLAERYLNDATKGWVLVEYNGLNTYSDGQAVLIPTVPFRLGGLTPTGYQTIPVLAYGSIAEGSGKDGQISRSAFEEQMGWLKNGGFTTITPAQLVAFMGFSGQIPQRAVLITVDTEAQTFFDLAVPILDEFGFTATLFVATDDVGREAAMTWDQLKRLQDAGFTIGSRGRQSPSLTDRKSGQPLEDYFRVVETDLQQAKLAIDKHLNTPMALLSYPFGNDGGLIPAMAAKIGYTAAFVNKAGENPFFGGRYAIHRRMVDGPMDPERFNDLLITRVRVDLNQ